MNENDHCHVYMMSEGILGNIEEFFDFSSDGKAKEIMDSSSDGSNSNAGDNYCDNNTEISAASHGGEGCGVAPTSEENEINNVTNASEKDWVTNFFDPQFDIDIPATFVPVNDFIDNDESVFGPLSPNSVLDDPIIISINRDGSSSSSISRPPIRQRPITPIPARAHMATPVGPTIVPVPGRARSKRARRPASVRFTAPVIPPSAEGPPAIPTFLDTIQEPMKIPPVKKMKNVTRGDNHPDGIMPLRKCKHCGISKTPQWRAGPMGPKTLCNACGVRYKSGRLFPEYRPAASPTFVPSLHSNSHKKVVEMRNKAATGAKKCELLAYIRDQGEVS